MESGLLWTWQVSRDQWVSKSLDTTYWLGFLTELVGSGLGIHIRDAYRFL